MKRDAATQPIVAIPTQQNLIIQIRKGMLMKLITGWVVEYQLNMPIYNMATQYLTSVVVPAMTFLLQEILQAHPVFLLVWILQVR